MANATDESIINFDPLIQCLKDMPLCWRTTAIVSSIAIALELVYFILFAIPWGKMGVAEWAYWVGAIGTILAVCGAIWISHRDNSLRRRDAMTIAILAAADSQSKVQQIGGVLDKTIKYLSKGSENWLIEAYFTSAKTTLNSRPRLTIEAISQLAPLKGDCALKFAKIQNTISNVAVSLSEIEVYKLSNPDSLLNGKEGVAVMNIEHDLSILTTQRKKLWEVQEVLRTTSK